MAVNSGGTNLGAASEASKLQRRLVQSLALALGLSLAGLGSRLPVPEGALSGPLSGRLVHSPSRGPSPLERREAAAPVHGEAASAGSEALSQAAWTGPSASLPAEFLAGHEVKTGDPARPLVALTFDCENGSGRAAGVLDALGRARARATFFITADFARLLPDLVVRIVAGGHEIANHSASHMDLTTADQEQVAAELEGAYTAVTEALARSGVRGGAVLTRWFRFPYGARDETRLAYVAAAGYQSVFWSLDPKGWRRGATADAVAATIIEGAQAGDIVIQHCHAAADVEALPTVIAGLRARGLEPAALAQVVRTEDLAPDSRLGVPPSGPETPRHAPQRVPADVIEPPVGDGGYAESSAEE